MSGEVRALYRGSVTPTVDAGLRQLDNAINDAIARAKALDVPQGLIVAILHALDHRETETMLED